MKYEITEDQYRKIILNFLTNIIGDLKVKEQVNNYIDIHSEDGTFLATILFKVKNKSLPGGCKTLIELSHNFMGSFSEAIPMVPELFSKIMLEYFANNLGFESQCIDFSYPTGVMNDNGREKVQYYIHNTKKKQ